MKPSNDPAGQQTESDLLEKIARAATGGSFVDQWVNRAPNLRKRAKRAVVRFVLRRARKILARVLRAGKKLAPVYIAILAWIAAAIIHMIDKGWVPLVFAGSLGVLPLYWWCGGPLGRRWTRRRNLKPVSHRAWYAAAYATLMLLSLATALRGIWVPMPGFWLVATLTFLVRWMYHFRIRKSDGPVGFSEHEVIQMLRRVKKLADVPMEEPKVLQDPARIEVIADLSDTEMLVPDAAQLGPKVAQKFKLPRASVIIDEFVPGIDAQARITIVKNNPTHQPLIYDESWIYNPKIDPEGAFRLHGYSDGKLGRMRLWNPGDGSKNALFSGDIGSGKSAAMMAGVIQAMMTGRCYPMLGDPQQGQSLPALAQVVLQPPGGDAEQIWKQLKAIKQAMLDRSKYLSDYQWVNKHGDHERGMGFFDPILLEQQDNPLHWPILLYVLDEAHLVCKDPIFGDMIAQLLEDIIKLSRKTGIAMWLATQYPGIEELGNRMPIRQNLIANHVFAFRNSAQVAGTMMLRGDMPAPYDIPQLTPDGEETKGMATIMSCAPGSTRNTYARTVWIDRQTYWARIAAKRIMALDEVTGNAFADANFDPEDAALDAMAADADATIAAAQRETITVPAPAPAAAPKPAPAPQPRPAPAAAAKPREKKPTTAEACIAYLRGLEPMEGLGLRVATTGVLAHNIGANLNTVSTAMRRAEGRNLVHQHREGMWALGPAPADNGAALVTVGAQAA